MSFSEPQIKLLSSKLNGKHVRTRELRGRTLSYVEGWHVIAEANRIFGFDGWDRETAWAECIWAEAKREPQMCAYAARVRIRVRAGDTIICREGSGVGHGSGATLGEAHESALKEAETDAMKRRWLPSAIFSHWHSMTRNRMGCAGARTTAQLDSPSHGRCFRAPEGRSVSRRTQFDGVGRAF
jgi:hypothetical protein